MKKSYRKYLIIALVFLAVSCATAAIVFSLDDKNVIHSPAIITGVASFASGYYLPTSTSVMEISLSRVFPAGNSYEISHSRIKNIQKFPVQFTLRYDSAEIDDSCTYFIDVSFTTDNVNYKTDSSQVEVFSTETPISLTLR